MSFTNLSLVPAEMIVCGVIPVIVGPANVRVDLANEYARWVDPSPHRLADELGAIISDPEPSPAEVAGSLRGMNWDSTGQVVVETIEDEVYGPVDASASLT